MLENLSVRILCVNESVSELKVFKCDLLESLNVRI